MVYKQHKKWRRRYGLLPVAEQLTLGNLATNGLGTNAATTGTGALAAQIQNAFIGTELARENAQTNFAIAGQLINFGTDAFNNSANQSSTFAQDLSKPVVSGSGQGGP